MRKTLALFLSLSLVFADALLAFADDTEIFGANVQPNVLILLDSSGSMNDEVTQNPSPYTSTTTYPGSYTSGVVYNQRSNSYRFYANSIADVPSASARDSLSRDGFWIGRIGGSGVRLYVGNYINYLACTACQGQERKIDIAKRVIGALVNNTEGVRFGVMRFANNSSQGQGGAGMVAPVGTAPAAIIGALNAINASGYTPLGEQLRDAGLYYKGQFQSHSSAIQLECQPSFIIMVSDGLQNGTVDVRVEATNRYTQDHASGFSGTQNVIVHTVGFSIDASERTAANDVLQAAATNGGGAFYYADNSTQLEQALQEAISQIISAVFSFATPVVPTTSTTGSTKAYLAAFQSDPLRPFWRGFLKAYQRDSNGQIPVDGNGIPLDSALVWDAGQRLSQKAASSRVVYTAIGNARESFAKSNGNITSALLNVSSSSERDKVIDFTLGIDAYDEDGDGNTTEERAWKLGDIFHSSPVLVSRPRLPLLDPTYIGFRQGQASRTAILIAGSNDGMLHAFRESDGEELWAFIPPEVLDRLQDLKARSGAHDFYVDSSPIAADVKIASQWKTIVVFGLRRGGKSYYALDITDTTNPLFLWSFTDSKMGETWSEPAIGKVQPSSEQYVAFVGGGHDTLQNNASGKAFFIIDLATGAKLWEYTNAAGSTDDRQYVSFSLAANPTAVDINGDGFVDTVYAGDIGGQMWKFDVSAVGTANWTGKRLFAADPTQAIPPPEPYYPAQAIYVSPILSLDASGNLWLFFGTGDRNHPMNSSSNRFYAIKENTTMTNGSAVTPSSLVDVTSGTGTVTQGWFVQLASNEKALAAADVFNKTVFFTTFKPASVSSCASSGGDAKLYAVNMGTGDAALNLATAQPVSSGQSALAWGKSIGGGIPSRPVVSTGNGSPGGLGNPLIITGTTNSQIASTPVPPVPLRRLIGWREVF